MKTIHVAGKRFLTGSELADAVMRYSLELARAELLDDVGIIFRKADGKTGRALIRVGWRIDTVVTFDPGETDERLNVDALLAILDKEETLRAWLSEHA
jgi:hypothetical protein